MGCDSRLRATEPLRAWPKLTPQTRLLAQIWDRAYVGSGTDLPSTGPIPPPLSLLRSHRNFFVAFAVLLSALAWSAPARADHRSGELGVRGVSERKLRAFETRVLGPAHAREHARLRRARRAGKLSRRALGRASNTRKASSRRLARAAAVEPAVGGRWGAPFSIPVMGIHAAVLPTGKVMWFSYPKNPNPRFGDRKCAQHGPGMAVEPGDRAAHSSRSAAVARPCRRTAQARQHLVRRSDFYLGWAACRLWRKPFLRQRHQRLEGVEQGLHVQPLERNLDRTT